MKRRPIKARKHYILFAPNSPFKGKQEVDRKKQAKRGYQKHKKKHY
jgi:hypothetical protein